MVAIRKKVGSRGHVPSKPLKDGKKVVFEIDYTIPSNDGIFDKETSDAFQQYMTSRIKLHGRAGKLGTRVKVYSRDARLHVATKMAYRKKYFKYLTKKFLKKKGLREYMRILSKGKRGYAIRYFNIEDQ